MRLRTQRANPAKTPGKRRGAWWTPPKLADKVVEWAGVTPGMTVLDAGAGEGGLTRPLLVRGARVVAVELALRSIRALDRMAGESDGRLAVLRQDFLQGDPRMGSLAYELGISNPPWEDDLPDVFMLRMLEHAHRAVGVLPMSLLAGVGSAEGLWRVARPTRIAVCVRRPNFDPANDGGQRDCIVVEALRRSSLAPDEGQRARVSIEWWHDRWN